MIQIKIKTPVKAYIYGTDVEISLLKEELTYTNTSVSYQLSKHVKNKYLRQARPEAWEAMRKEMQSKLKKTLVFNDSLGVYIRPGSISYLKIPHEVIANEIKYPEPKMSGYAWAKKPLFESYDYQKESVELLINEKHGGGDLATGLGKSHIILMIAKTLGLKTVVMTPSKSIFGEILENFETHLGKNNVGAFGDGIKKLGKNVTVCIAKSLSMVKKGSPEWEELSKAQVIIGDECHTVPAATLEPVTNDLLGNAPYRFFLSGTQTRGDGSVKLLRSITSKIVISRNTKWGIENGYLCPLKFFIKSVPSPRPGLKTPNILKMTQTHFFYNPYIINFITKTASALANIKKESSLILVDEISQIAEIAAKLTVPFGYVHGNTTKKEDLERMGLAKTDLKKEIDKFNRGEIKVLIGTSCISTGTNMYPTHNVFNFQGGASEIGTKQGAIGRPTRLLEKSRFKDFHVPKLFSKVWDFNVLEIEKMESHLEERKKFYEETGGSILYL